jgi:hypothetical protein
VSKKKAGQVFPDPLIGFLAIIMEAVEMTTAILD